MTDVTRLTIHNVIKEFDFCTRLTLAKWLIQRQMNPPSTAKKC